MAAEPITENTLFYGDNLDILREYIPSNSIDLIYLDPPFNSNRTYNVLFKDEHGADSESQITAFEDTWHWSTDTQQTYDELLTNSPDHIAKILILPQCVASSLSPTWHVSRRTLRCEASGITNVKNVERKEYEERKSPSVFHLLTPARSLWVKWPKIFS